MPSKTFNLAGLVASYHIIYNRHIREQVEKESKLSRYNEMNVLSMHALISAYSQERQEWVDELCQVLSGNVFVSDTSTSFCGYLCTVLQWSKYNTRRKEWTQNFLLPYIY